MVAPTGAICGGRPEAERLRLRSSFAALELLAAVSQMTNERPYDHQIALLLQHCTNLLHPASKGRWDDHALIGARLPNLSNILINPKTQWQKMTVNGWYGGGERVVELVSGTAVWYHTGMPPVPMRWVLVREERGQVRGSGSPMHQ